ncbi:mucin-22-like [Plodia interpunctella]|uniref:mucin-22-like n=1 Tax=Plodia interpunctella TaxID=58824 RepID=UPI002368D202|nr:mucin-22-like [Plodia interpunctella]
MYMANMELHVIMHYLPLLLVLLAVEAFELNTSETESSRAPRSSRRVVRLYSGMRPEPIACLGEGLQSDPVNCAVFYRCMKSGRGRYMSFKFQCAPGTIFDPDTQGCNHPSAVKRSNCGIDNVVSIHEQIHDNAIEDIKQELPSPITTKLPLNTNLFGSSAAPLWLTSSQRQDLSTSIPWLTSAHNHNQINTISSEQSTHKTSNDIIRRQNTVSGQQQTRKQRSTTPRMSPLSHIPSAQIGDLCSSEGFMGDSENCRKFYRCISNLRGGYIRYEFMCTESTIWDDDIQSCNHAWAVKKRRCGRGNINDVSDETNKNQDIHNDDLTSRVTPNINLVQQTFSTLQTQGSSSYSTNNPLLIVMNSATTTTTTTKNPITPNHLFNIRQSQEFVSSTDKRTSTQNERDDVGYYNRKGQHDESSSSIECSENGFMGDKNDCKKFYRCVDNGRGSYTKYEFSCGEGTVWDTSIESCNHAWAVKECGEKGTKVPIQGTTAITSKPGNTTSTSTQSTPNYISIAQTTIEENDNNGYGNQNQETESTKTEPPSSISTTTLINKPGNDCTSSGFMGDEYDCKKFYRCVDNGDGHYTRYDFSCGEGTVWDSEIEACNHPWAVQKCGGSSSITTERTKPSSTTIKEIYTTQSIEVTQNDESDASYGIQHDESSSPPEDSLSSSTSITTTKQPQNSSNNCTSTGFIGDKSDCKKFYRCVDNGYGGFTRYEFTCGEGTVWDSNIQSCNHAWAVENCGGNMNNDINKEEVTTSSVTTTYSTTTTTTSHDNEIDTGYGQSSSQSTIASSTERPSQVYEVSTSECKDSGFMADKKNCKKFYRCVDNGNGGYIRYEFICGEGTIWDQEIQACNHDNGRSCTEQNHESNTKEPEYSNETENVNELSSTTNSVKTTTMSSFTESTQIQSSPADSNNDTCISEGFYANSMDCKKIYRCVDNGKGGFTKYEFTCGDGTMWVQDIQACDHIDADSNCSSYTSKPPQSEDNHSTTGQQSSSISTEASTTDYTEKPHDEYQENKSSKPIQENDNCSSEGFYPNRNDCKKFYRCVDNGQGSFTKYDFSCGEGTAWDNDIQTCNHISEVERCLSGGQEETQNKPMQDEGVSPNSESNAPTTDKTTTESSESNGISSTDSCESEGYFGNKQDCKKFYRCVDNGNGGYTKYDFDCGEGTIWDQDITTCNHPQDVVNPSCKQQSGASSSSAPSSSSTQSSNADSTSQSPTNCSQENTTKKPDNQNVTCEKAGYYANPNDCKKFYRCVDWDGNGEKFSVYHFECGEGTIWDPNLDTCNHEESVYPPRDCSGTQSQNENNVQENSTSQQTTESTTEQSTTTEQMTTEGTTTQESTTKESTTTEKQTTTDSTTTQQPVTTESTTTQQTTTTEETTTSTTTEGSTTTEETQQTTTTEKSTQPTTTESSTTQQTTTTDSTTESTTSTEQSTTEESTTQQSTTSQTSTTDSSETTESSTSTDETTENPSSTTETTSTTEQKEDESTTESSSTEGTSSEQECPDTDEDQYLYVCPTSFRRHPKYCNMFYQCTEDDENHEPKIAVFTCPNNTIYDESQTQCVEESKAEKKCKGQIAQRRRIKRFEKYYKEPIVVGKERFSCSTTGNYPFEKTSECSPAFFKCQKAKSGHLRGYVHKCPEGYLYWSISKRCERKENLKDCKTSSNDWSRRWEIPVERKNIAL